MKAVRYPPEFKAKALKQGTERGHGGGWTQPGDWGYQEHQGVGSGENAALRAEVSRLKAELKRADEARDVLTKTAT